MNNNTPITKSDIEKLYERELKRDELNHTALKTQGWKVRVIWECEVASLIKTAPDLKSFS